MATTAAVSETPFRPAAWPRWLLFVGRVTLGVIFVVAAYTKLHFNGSWHLGDYYFFFGMGIDSYGILPLWGVDLLARILPWFEAALGVALISGIGLRWTGLAASALLVVFITALTRAYMHGLEIVCGCFGNNEKLGPLTLVRDGSFLLLALAITIGAFLIKKRKSTLSS
jgi:uncharacterized membrane protein YphA (DoxX/SURF4 family)